MNNAKKQMETIKWERLEISSRKLEIPRECFIQRGLNELVNHNGVITHLEPDILECEVQLALGSITMNKASEGDGTSAELFKILKDDVVKVLHSISSVQSLSRV